MQGISLDARRFTTSFEYDAFGRTTATVNALAGRSTTEYDALGNVTATVNASGGVVYLYDKLCHVHISQDTVIPIDKFRCRFSRQQAVF